MSGTCGHREKGDTGTDDSFLPHHISLPSVRRGVGRWEGQTCAGRPTVGRLPSYADRLSKPRAGSLDQNATERVKPEHSCQLARALVAPGTDPINRDIGRLNRRIVLENDAVFGSVNANRTHNEMAAT